MLIHQGIFHYLIRSSQLLKALIQYTEEERRNFRAAWYKSEISGDQFYQEMNIRPTIFYNRTKNIRNKMMKNQEL